ncbi:MAG: FecR family protein [Methylococcales bacterium]
MQTRSSDSNRILRKAMEWFVRLQDEGCDPTERTRFQDWLAQSEAHRLAYAEAEKLWNNLDGIKGARIPGLDAARTASAEARTRSRTITALLLASTLCGGLWWQDRQAPTAVYSTGIGERRRIDLADGSRIDLYAATLLSAHMSWIRREVDLRDGEALFDVIHQGLRPFTVLAGDLRIRDAGTRFNVRKGPEGASVSVLEGEVELNDGVGWNWDRLPAGFRRGLDARGKLNAAESMREDQAIARTNGRLIFERTPLREVAAELGRHHPVRFVFAEPGLALETLSGSFDAGDLNPFLNAVEKILPVSVKRKEGIIGLDRKRKKSR